MCDIVQTLISLSTKGQKIPLSLSRVGKVERKSAGGIKSCTCCDPWSMQAKQVATTQR